VARRRGLTGRASGPHPYRKVLEYPFPALTEAPSDPGFLSHTRRNNRMWVLALACGHTTLSEVRYVPAVAPAGGGINRNLRDYLPHPRRARCGKCPPGSVGL